jgi:aladin
MIAFFPGQGANWDPDGRVALLSFSNSTTLGSIHFSSKPPSLGMYRLPSEYFDATKQLCSIIYESLQSVLWSLSSDAHLLPVELPEISSLIVR